MKEKRWIIREGYDLEVVNSLADSLGVDQIIATLLVERGVTTFKEAKRFFRPSLDQLHDPFLMKNMDKAIERINRAISQGERIMVYGDYDVDGTSAVALVYSYFSQFHTNIDFYIPDRDTEGYGISFKGIDYAHETGVRLVIALDCGIKAVEQVAYANSFGIDVIVGDHHLPGDVLPAALALLDPKQADCPYPYKELSGCGIGFKIVEAYVEEKMGVRLCDDPGQLNEVARKHQEELQLKLLKYLDLVALSIASDIVPIMGENRVLATYGLKVINTRPRPGIEALLKYGHVLRRGANNEAQDDKKTYFMKDLTISDLVFLIGPRINAAGRIRSAQDSVRLLMSQDMDESIKLAEEINNFNSERKDLDFTATEEARQMMMESDVMPKRRSIVLFNSKWHKGVVGIVASRLVEEFYKPTIIFTEGADNLLVGSARSIKDFDIHTALEECSDLLEHFGGHTSAAGVSLKPENLERFAEMFDQVVQRTLGNADMVPEVVVDAVINFHDHINAKFLRILKQFAPFGPENNQPIFCTRNLVDTGFPRLVGLKEVRHLKFSPIQFDTRSRAYSAIGFQLGQYYDRVKRGDHFDLCYQLEENFWHGKTEIQLNVKDIKFTDE
jgi:single-stranded-DNA-specific exonuclease